ncbi:hypothetical protein [Lichenibacterium ramalinae]|uniref:Uncharacterized protein n=1 Tax=Lichenibacterium ramalinae TaxID=2316527 RepID=A0A4Q2RB87_9HYPH|nr:hypothetical protein [Lichenibacterium ramalinae]RYB03279.1 hypothetical protein D3272_17815 [Lichenibacterium ramalinae]
MPTHWTVTAIRAKADALEARGAGRITLAAETLGLMVTALRFLATEGMAERRASYTVEVWDASGNHIVEHIGSLSNHAAAHAAFDAACASRPNQRVTLRQGIRIVTRRGLDGEANLTA